MPLKVIVIGAGLGGLGAAIAFTRAGHHVEVSLCGGLYLKRFFPDDNTGL